MSSLLLLYSAIICTVVYVTCCYHTGYAADPSVSDASAPDAVIGDVQKFKEMKGLHVSMLT